MCRARLAGRSYTRVVWAAREVSDVIPSRSGRIFGPNLPKESQPVSPMISVPNGDQSTTLMAPIAPIGQIGAEQIDVLMIGME